MTTAELNSLVEHIRYQANTWLGGEASENLERLIKQTYLLHERMARIDALRAQGFQFVKIEQINDNH
jgi:hypothetical protein